MVTIKKVSNGYVVSYQHGRDDEVYIELQKVFARLLQHFEGLASTFGGALRGTVTIQRGVDERDDA